MSFITDYIRNKKLAAELRQKLLAEQKRRALLDEEEENRQKQQAYIEIGNQADYEEKKKNRKLKRKYILGQIAKMTLTILCVIGIKRSITTTCYINR